MRDATARESDPGASIKTLTALRQAEAACTRYPLYRFATQAVSGEGAVWARGGGGGATAARSVLGKAVSVLKVRKRALQLADGAVAVVTVHPSFLLRIKDPADKKRGYRNFVRDLQEPRKLVSDEPSA